MLNDVDDNDVDDVMTLYGRCIDMSLTQKKDINDEKAQGKPFKSKALEVNLAVTRVQEIEFNARYALLTEAVEGYKGVRDAAEQLLYELHHPFKNWNVIIGEYRAFTLKNLRVYLRCAQAKEVIEIELELFLSLIVDAPKEAHKKEACDGLLAFLEKVAEEAAPGLLIELMPCLERTFNDLMLAGPDIARFLAESLHPLPKTIGVILGRTGSSTEEATLIPHSFINASITIIGWVRKYTYNMWLSCDDPIEWLEATCKKYDIALTEEALKEIREVLLPVSHKTLRKTLEKILYLTDNKPDKASKDSEIERLKALIGLSGNIEIVRHYRNASKSLSKFNGLNLLFLFHIMELPGLYIIHEETIRGINRILIGYIKNADTAQLKDMLPRDFALLEQQAGKFPQTALQCIEALGTEILRLDDPQITELFLGLVIDFGFETPNIKGVDSEWHVLRNPAHLQNIRVWLKLIGMRPYQCSSLLSALLINIKLGGICIKDTDLFQKDVSRLLNQDIRPVYNLVKQLSKQFPVYFNEIGAEGLLRDVSTELDEITHRKDRLIHFLRKQSHVESNNLIVDFIRAILCYWYSRDKDVLRSYIPDELMEELPSSGPFIDPVHRLVRFISEEFNLEPFSRRVSHLVNVDENVLLRTLEKVPDCPPDDKKRFFLLIKMYRLETLKYRLGTQEIIHHLEGARRFGFSGLEEIIEAISSRSDDTEGCLEVILKHLESLKEIILSDERFEEREDIYLKRHIAVDIPSMYGWYHEKKFDALSLTFRLENLANTYFERLINEFDLRFITYRRLKLVLRILKLLWRGVKVDGIQSKKFETYLTLFEQALHLRQFSFAQFRDIVQGLLEGVKDVIYIYYINQHQENLPRIIKGLYPDRLIEKYRRYIKDSSSDKAQIIHKISESFLRDLIAGTFGLQYLDIFISRVHHIFEEEREVLSEKNLDLLLTYDPESTICPIHTPYKPIKDLIHLGNKGFNLIQLHEEGLPVPAGIIITTEIFRCKDILDEFPRVFSELKERLKDALHPIEDRLGRRFGHPKAPLFLSVRSGAAISMPGMMSTIINVGSNIATIEGLSDITGKMWFAWDNYRRFIQSWAMGCGLSRDVFTKLMIEHKRRAGVEKKRQFTGEQMRELALLYREATEAADIEVIDDPWDQLMHTIRLVLNSWGSKKARAYREIMDISDRWGTAVIVQVMTFGNMSEESGTGVVFTTNPNYKMDRISLWGDYTPGNQGEDIVSGLVSTYPISLEQKEFLNVDEPCLEEAFPQIYKALLGHVRRLIEERGWSHQEIEFTFESPEASDLYILQTRDMTPKKKRSYPVFVKGPELKKAFLGRGIGVSGGALSGRIAFDLSDIERLKKEDPDMPVILVRSDTVPDDIKEISLADGLLTAKGGQTSHASIVALRLDKTCVVGFKGLRLYELKRRARINNYELTNGDMISIDGRNGAVYKGAHKRRV